MTVLTLIRTAPDFPPGSMPAYAKLVSQALKAGIDENFDVRVCDFFDPHAGGSMRRHHLWRLCHASRFFAETPSDLYHLLDGSMAGFLPSGILSKTVITVHDLIPLLQLQGRLAGRPGLMGRWLIRRSVRAMQAAAGLAAVSEHTRRDLSEQTGRSDIAVIPDPVRAIETGSMVPSLALPERYLFHIGNNAAYKNRAGVLDVFERLQDISDLHLLMAGPEPSAELRRRADQLKRVRFLVDVTDAELAQLYHRASVFVFPSLYEGFGMPVLEAMAAGCPVVCSSAASLPEVAGGSALLAPAEDTELLAKHCRMILQDAALRDNLILKGRHHAGRFTIEKLSSDLRAWYSQCQSPQMKLRHG